MRKGNLSAAFEISETSVSDERIKRLTRAVSQYSPTGAEMLRAAVMRGCSFAFSDELGNCLGSYFRDKKLIALNPKCRDAELVTTLVHEARHAVQNAPLVSTNKNIRSLLVSERAAEADAMAFECAAAYEMRDENPEAWFRFRAAHGGVALAYSRTVKSGEKGKTPLGEAFKAWFDDASYVVQYDRGTLDFLERHKREAGWDFLRNDVSGRAIAAKMCRHGGKPYLSDEAFLDSARALTVDEEIAKRCRAVADDAMLLYGRKDMSLSGVFVRSFDGIARPMSRESASDAAAAREKSRQELDDALREVLPPWARFKRNGSGR